jgi:hypothetical protein
MLYESLRNELEDRVIQIAEIEEKLHGIRKAVGLSGKTEISNSSMSKWKRTVGILGPIKTDKDGNIYQEIDRRRWITPREAAGLMVQALWESTIKEKFREDAVMLAIVPGLKAKNITHKNIKDVYDHWIGTTGGKDVYSIIKLIHTQVTYNEARILISKDLKLKKVLPVSTARKWVKELKGHYLANAPCPPDIIHKLIGLTIERRITLGRKSA